MDRIPPSWSHAADAQGFWRDLRAARRSLLMLDYDGTLAPFQQNRMQATIYPEVEERVITLSTLPNVHLLLVTGRSARELRTLLHSAIKADIWGSHGRELLKSDDSYDLYPLDPRQGSALDRMVEELNTAGFGKYLEIKPTSVAVHWRSTEPAAQGKISALVQSLYEETAGSGLHLLPFDGGVEFRSSDRTKGTAVRQVLSQEPAEVPAAYLGDDLTDEDAFTALGNRGLAILVRSEVRPSNARFWIRPPEELVTFLDGWVSAAQAASSPAGRAMEASR